MKTQNLFLQREKGADGNANPVSFAYLTTPPNSHTISNRHSAHTGRELGKPRINDLNFLGKAINHVIARRDTLDAMHTARLYACCRSILAVKFLTRPINERSART